MSYPWIRASEIGEYVYCHRAWWLKQVKGLQSANIQQIQAGQNFHHQHGRQVRQITWMRKIAYALIFLAVAIGMFQLLIGWL